MGTCSRHCGADTILVVMREGFPSHVIILGCGRSGTSIFGELFEHIPGYMYYSEPPFDVVVDLCFEGYGEKHVTFFAASERNSVKAVAYHELIDEAHLRGRFDIAFVLRRRTGPEPVEIQIRQLVPATS